MTRCLVVDDVEVTRFTTKELLGDMGIDSDVVANTEAALQSLQSGEFDLVLLDWHIGKESGLDFIATIRSEFGSTIPVIVFSGVEDESRSSEAIKAGANFFLQKPTTKEKLKQGLQSLGIKTS